MALDWENVGEREMNAEQKPDEDRGGAIILRLDPAIARELRAEAERRGLGLAGCGKLRDLRVVERPCDG
jgi:hypothetical protein